MRAWVLQGGVTELDQSESVWLGEEQMHEEGSTQAGGVGKESRKYRAMAGGFLGCCTARCCLCVKGAGGPGPAGPALPSCVLSPARSLEPLRKRCPTCLPTCSVFRDPVGAGTSLRWGLKWESLFQVWELLAQPDPHAALQAWERPLAFIAECRGREMDLLSLSCLNLNSFFTTLEPPAARGCQFS